MNAKKKMAKEKKIKNNQNAKAWVEPVIEETDQNPENIAAAQEPAAKSDQEATAGVQDPEAKSGEDAAAGETEPEIMEKELKTCLTCRLLKTFEGDDKKGFCPKLEISIKLKRPKKNCEYWRMPV